MKVRGQRGHLVIEEIEMVGKAFDSAKDHEFDLPESYINRVKDNAPRRVRLLHVPEGALTDAKAGDIAYIDDTVFLRKVTHRKKNGERVEITLIPAAAVLCTIEEEDE